MENSLKLHIVGDGAVGKTCLFITYSTNNYPTVYVPTAYDWVITTITVDGTAYNVGLCDTAGGEDFDRLRPLGYAGTDAFLLAFSINDPTSLENIKLRWLPEVRHFCPDVPCLVVGCKSDLRILEEVSSGRDRLMSFKEVSDFVESLGLKYVETSALKHMGLSECFDSAVRLAVAGKIAQKKKKGLFPFRTRRGKQLLPPDMPPAGKAPWLEVETSTFADQWYNRLQDPRFHDVTFVVEGDRQLQAHKVVVCSASKFFTTVLGLSAGGRQTEQQQHQMSTIDDYSMQDLNSGRVEGIVRVYHEEEKTTLDTVQVRSSTVVLSEDVKAPTFLHVLEFLYTGMPRLPKDVPETEVEELSRVAGLYQLPQLQTICANLQNEEEFLNPSIGTFLNDETGAAMKRLFFNQPEHADVVFNVQGSSVFAHRVVLSTHSDVMAAMFSGHFSEGNDQVTVKVNITDTSLGTFLTFLEYLYTDHAPIEEGDGVGMLMLADKYCVPRLCTLSELHISEEVERHCAKPIEKSDIDVIALLNTAEMYNAKQLVQWCLHFISTNFLSFERRKEFADLTADHRKYVTENRWPPLSYLQKVEEYEKKMARKGEKCLVM